MDIGHRIRLKRKQLHIKQDILCQDICSVTYLSRIENGKANPNPLLLKRICNRLGLSQDGQEQNHAKDLFVELKNIYPTVKNRHATKARELLNVFKNQHHTIVEPSINVIIELLDFEISVMEGDKEKAKGLKKGLEAHQDSLEGETWVWYCKALGYYEYNYGDVKESVRCFLEAKEAIEMINLDKDPHVDYLIGLAYSREDQIAKSIVYTEKALASYRDLENNKRIIDCLMLLGIDYGKIGLCDQAEQHYLSIIQLENKDPIILGYAYHNLGYLSMQMGQHQKAVKYLQKAIEVKEERDALSTWYLLAHEYKRVGDRKKAINISHQSQIVALRCKNLYYYYKFYILYTTLTDKKDQLNAFINKMEQDIIPFYSKQDLSAAYKCYKLLAKMCTQLRKYKMATFYYNRALDLRSNLEGGGPL